MPYLVCSEPHGVAVRLLGECYMRRREFITLLGGAAIVAPRAAIAQTSSKVYRLGTLGPRDPIGDKSPFGAIIVRVLAQRGYTLGQNLVLDARGAMGEMGKLPEIFRDMKASNVDAIVLIGYPLALAAKATGIPTVVVFGAGDPVSTGLVDGLARPGGNLTGISDVSAEVTPKRLDLLKQFAPRLRKVAMLWNAADLGMMLRYRASETGAQALGISVQALGVRELNDFDQAFAAMTRDMPDAILMVSDSLTILNRKRVFEFAA